MVDATWKNDHATCRFQPSSSEEEKEEFIVLQGFT